MKKILFLYFAQFRNLTKYLSIVLFYSKFHFLPSKCTNFILTSSMEQTFI